MIHDRLPNHPEVGPLVLRGYAPLVHEPQVSLRPGKQTAVRVVHETLVERQWRGAAGERQLKVTVLPHADLGLHHHLRGHEVDELVHGGRDNHLARQRRADQVGLLELVWLGAILAGLRIDH